MISLDPVKDASYHFDTMAYELLRENYITEQMEEKRTKVLQKLGRIVGEQLAEDFASILSFSWIEQHESAMNLAARLNLKEEDFAAIEKNFSYFERRVYET